MVGSLDDLETQRRWFESSGCSEPGSVFVDVENVAF